MAVLGAVYGQFAPLDGACVGGPFTLGTEVVVRFMANPVEDHARIIVGHVSGTDYVCLTPDQDLWIESLVADLVDIFGVYVRPADRTMPFMLPADGTYLHDFPAAPVAAQWDGLLFIGQTAANEERITRGLVAGPVVPAAPPLPPPAGAPAGLGVGAAEGAIVPVGAGPGPAGGGLAALAASAAGVGGLPAGGAPAPAAAVPPAAGGVGAAAAPPPAAPAVAAAVRDIY